MRVNRSIALTAAAAALALTASACGGGASSGTSTPGSAANPNAAEQNPAGDIPDNQAFIDYAAPSGGFTVKVPEGWARTASGNATTFTDKLNSVRVEQLPAAAAPTEASFRSGELPMLQQATAGFRLGKLRSVTLPAGPAVVADYTGSSAPDPVTGRSVEQDVQRYELWRGGQEVVLTLAGPRGADNVDPWRTVTESLQWQK